MSKTFSKNKDAKELEVPFTMVPNFALDTIEMRSPAENCLYFVIIRQTVGYLNQNGSRKSKADLSISRLVKLTGLSRQGVLNSRRKLYDAGWILYRINSSMTSYGIIDRYDEFRKNLESTDLTEPSQLSRQGESTDLTEPSQLSRHIKESKINTIKEIEKEETSLSYMNLKSKFSEKLKSKNIQYIESRKEYGSISLMQELKIEPQEILDMVDILEEVKRNNPDDRFLQGICFTMSHMVSYRANIYNAYNTKPKQEFAYVNKSSGGFE